MAAGAAAGAPRGRGAELGVDQRQHQAGALAQVVGGVLIVAEVGVEFPRGGEVAGPPGGKAKDFPRRMAPGIAGAGEVADARREIGDGRGVHEQQG